MLATVFGSIDAARENAFCRKKEELYSLLLQFADQYDSMKDVPRNDLSFRANYMAFECDAARAEIISRISAWVFSIRQDFSCNTPEERPIFGRLLAWAKMAQKITNNRPFFQDPGEEQRQRATWPSDDYIFPPKAAAAAAKRHHRFFTDDSDDDWGRESESESESSSSDDDEDAKR